MVAFEADFGRDDGLELRQVRVPFGVVGIVVARRRNTRVTVEEKVR